MLIKVTKEHIDNGIQKSCTRCPIALAIQEARPDLHVIVVHTCVEVYQSKEERDKAPFMSKPIHVIDLPEKARNFISVFDGNTWVREQIKRQPEPFEFELELP